MLDKLQYLLKRLEIFEKNTTPEKQEAFCNETMDYDGTQDFSFDSLQSLDFISSPSKANSRENVDPILREDPRYLVGKLLGKGGMAKVWKVKDSELLREVALKILHSDRRLDLYEQENFVIEAQITSQLQHPGIVPIYELKRLEEGQTYFTMREIKGEVFREKIKNVHSISTSTDWRGTSDGWNLRRLIGVLIDICQALSYAHSKGVIHRDLKPANIMIGEYGEVLLVDWGIAKLITLGKELDEIDSNLVRVNASSQFVERRKSSIAGTPSYMAPEQINGSYEEIGAPADIYSLGIILYEILVGHKPFYGTVQEIFQAKLHQDTPSIFEHLEELVADDVEFRPVPDELAQICLKCMQKSPEDRYQSIKDVMHAIQSWLDGAQREEKARSILAEVDRKKQEIADIYLELEALRQELEQKICQDKVDTKFWTDWKNIQERQEDILVLEEDCIQAYQAALIHSPEVIDVYRGLIELEYKEYLEALTDMNYRAIKKIEKRIRLYLNMLPVKEQRYWEHIRLVDRASSYSQRTRGISIERKEPEEYMLEQLRTQSWISIVGMAGIGKTHLAWIVSSRWCKQEQAELVFCDVSGCDSNFLFLKTLAQSLGISNFKNALQEELIQCAQKRGKFVLLIDNAENISAEGVSFLEKLVSSSSNLTVLTTTRKSFGSSLEHQYRLPFMSYMEGLELFMQHAKRRRVDWNLTEENRYYLLKIIERLDRLPLALKLAAGRISELSLREIEQRLSKDTSILTGKNNASQETLHTALELSCSMLGEKEQDLFSQIAIFPASFRLEMVEFVAIWDGSSVLDLLEVLVDDNLLLKESDDSGVRYSMLHSIREYGISLLEENLKQTIYHRHSLYFAELYRANSDFDTGQEDFFAQLILEFPNFVQGAKFGPFDVAKDCCLACLIVLEQRGPFSLAFEIIEEFLARKDVVVKNVVEVYTIWSRLCRIQGDIEQSKRIIHKVSSLYLNTIDGELEEFVYPLFSPEVTDSFQPSEKIALQLWEEGEKWLRSSGSSSSEKLVEAFSHYYLLQDFEKQEYILRLLLEQAESEGEYFVALGYANRLKELADSLEDPKKKVEILNKMAVLLTRMGKEKQAIGEYNHALLAAKILQDQDNEARIYCNLGILFQARGELGEALSNYEVSKKLFEEQDKKFAIGVLLSNIGTTHQIQGNFKEAKSSFEEAIVLAEESGQSLHQAIFEGNLGAILMELSDFSAAEFYLRKAIDGCALQASYASGAFKGYLAVLLARKGSFMAANILLDEAEEQLIEVKEEYGKFLCRKIEVCFLEHNLEQIKHLVDRIERVIRELKMTETSELVRNFREIQNKIPLDIWITEAKYLRMRQEALIYAERAEIHLVQTQYSQAESYFTKALNIFQILNDDNQELNLRGRLALSYSHQGELKKAILIYEELVEKYQQQGKLLAYANTGNLLGSLYRRQSQLDKALEILTKATDILRRFKREISLITVLDRKGVTHQSRGEYKEALEAFIEAKELAEKNDIVPATVLGNLGALYMVMGDWDNAILSTQKAVNFFHAQRDRNKESMFLGNIANAYVEMENFEAAEKIYRQIIHLVRELGIKESEGFFLGNLGDCLMQNRKYEEAEGCFTQAIEMMRESFPLAGEAFLASYAELALLMGYKELAKERIEQVNEELFGTTADELIKFLIKKATIYQALGDIKEGENILRRVKSLIFEYDFKKETSIYRAFQVLEERYR